MKGSNLIKTDPHIKEARAKNKKRQQRLNDGFLTDQDIKRIRGKFGLTPKEMAEKLKVGEKNFARYENLSVRQSKAMDNLLRILDKYPDAIKILEVKRLISEDMKKNKQRAVHSTP